MSASLVHGSQLYHLRVRMQVRKAEYTLPGLYASRIHVYTAKLDQEQAQRSFVSDMLDTVFGGSPKSLVMRALETEDVTAADLAEIRKAIDEFDPKG